MKCILYQCLIILLTAEYISVCLAIINNFL